MIKNKVHITIFFLKNKKIKKFKIIKLIKIKKNLKILYKYLNFNSIFPIIISLLFLDSIALMESENNIHHYILQDNGDLTEVTNEEEKEKMEKEKKLNEEKMKQEEKDFNIFIIILIILFGFLWFYYFNGNSSEGSIFSEDSSKEIKTEKNKYKPFVLEGNPVITCFRTIYNVGKAVPCLPEVLEDYEKFLKSDEDLKVIQNEYKESLKEREMAFKKTKNAEILTNNTAKEYDDTLKEIKKKAKEAADIKIREKKSKDEILVTYREIFYSKENKEKLAEIDKKYFERKKIFEEAHKEYDKAVNKSEPCLDRVLKAEYAKSIFLKIQDIEAKEAAELKKKK